MSTNSGAPSRRELVDHGTDDGEEARPTTAVVEVVGDLVDRPATSLTPLYDVVDPDAVNRLFEHGSESAVELSFTYEGHDVTVARSGDRTVVDAEPASPD